MKTAVTIINTVQVGIDEFKDVRTTKAFNDNSTLLEIKEWIKKESKLDCEAKDIGLSGYDFSNLL